VSSIPPATGTPPAPLTMLPYIPSRANHSAGILTDMDARGHADQWLAGWNARDLDAVMACYSDDVDFAAPTVVTRWDRPDGRLHGKAELRRHFERGMQLAPELEFTEETFLTSPGGYALFYRRENGNRALDVVELDRQGRAARVRAFYERAQS
jgi:SnoaL-like domain